MKIQTSALVEKFIVDGHSLEIEDGQKIKLEFSALDTGSRFHDTRLDFVYEIQTKETISVNEQNDHAIQFTMGNTSKTYPISYCGKIKYAAENAITGYGRLKENQLSEEIIRFILTDH